MGFTVQDMLIISRDRYEMKLLAGDNGWANSISWLLMVEDNTIIKNFRGKELAVTTGLGYDTEEKLLELVSELDEHHCAGLIINVGCYIYDIPQKVIDFCNEKDLPLMICPWDISMSEMIKDLTVRIFLQTQTDEQISGNLIKAIERPNAYEEYRDELSATFDVDGKFQVVLFTTENLDKMDTVERKRIGYRLQIYLENISHNAHFFYYAGTFILVFNAVDDKSAEEIIVGFLKRSRRRMPDQEVYVGVGSAVMDIINLRVSYQRALYSIKKSMAEKQIITHFNDLGIEKLLYSISDKLIAEELIAATIKPVIEYDEKHNSDFLTTLTLYLEHNGSIQAVANEMYIHKNTILYRMNKIKEMLGDDIDDGQKRLLIYLACMLKRMKL